MEVGAPYDKKRLHAKGYFGQLMTGLEEVPESVRHLLALSRSNLELFDGLQRSLTSALAADPSLAERVARLMRIRGVGQVLALTWALEVGDPARFGSIRQAISYCGLCSAQNSSAGIDKRGPLSKMRNKHLQSILVEAAKLAPRWNPQLRARA